MMEVSWGAWKVLTYKIAIYRKETVGSRFVKYVEVTEKPSLDTGYWFDLTNGIWAKWESIHDKKLADMSVEPGN
jgi:hypothetical protein